eukprot:CAMPEP_0194782758 /NCGR_PEP_ID=MMETSP0323_2-20130528/78862_1 /TAXON_ID=2866 ORGANISM="Crypthecodinium cohnii, Strain Seligo" /NCGR_SAMPLE_ID=MMETSP0323_2 /ASSEMBLY_ACC=CAM_ASM_000346 /LENGTH=67 /DNA_ID=CAMNT_0039721595 /DNA_START=397 /DNA_END=600 /DNA_ORIENTATION=+
MADVAQVAVEVDALLLRDLLPIAGDSSASMLAMATEVLRVKVSLLRRDRNHAAASALDLGDLPLHDA